MAEPQRPNAGPVPAGPPGYVIRPPQPSAAAPAPPASVAPAPSAVTSPPAATTAVASHEPTLVGGLTQNGAVIGGALMLALAVVFFLFRNAVRSHLISHRAPLASANSASWSLFMFLIVAAFTVVFGILGQFWTVLSFIIPLGVLCLVTLVLFVVLFNSATRITR